MILAVLLPLILYFIALLTIDTFSISRKWFISYAFMYGIIIGLLLFVETIFFSDMNKKAAHWLFPIIEESAKLLPAILMIYRRRIVFFIDAILYGASIGFGFSTIENVLYIIYNNLSINTITFRSMSTSLMHAGCTALMTLMLFWAIYHFNYKQYRKMSISLLIFFIPFIHVIYNYNMLPPNISFIVLLIFFSIIFLLVAIHNEKIVTRWLYNETDSHIALLMAMRNGTFYETEAGKYLLAGKSRISSKKFALIEEYINCCLIFSIKAKGSAIARETGFGKDISPEKHQQILKEYKHIKILELKIGGAGLSIVRPIIHIRHSDRCSLRIYDI